MKALLIGANGQLGTDLQTTLAEQFEMVPLTHRDLELVDRGAVEQALATHRPDLVINTAAYNRVDDCEEDPRVAMEVNAVGPHFLARACRVLGARLVHFSTDYVFPGDRAVPWHEDDIPRPVNQYGVSKLAGEHAVRAACPNSYIVRVSGLFGLKGSRGKGGNFVETMLRLQAERRAIRVVNDQVTAPTFSYDVAIKLRELVLADVRPGVYHMTAAGACSWYEFARAIFDIAALEADLSPQRSEAAGLRAARPHYSVLANDALRAAGLSQIRPWSEGLRDYLTRRASLMAPVVAIGA